MHFLDAFMNGFSVCNLLIKANNAENKNFFYPFLMAVVAVASFSSCGIYSFADVSIPDSIKTVRINFFENRAQYVNPQLSPYAYRPCAAADIKPDKAKPDKQRQCALRHHGHHHKLQREHVGRKHHRHQQHTTGFHEQPDRWRYRYLAQ
jgi:hypothetical protein